MTLNLMLDDDDLIIVRGGRMASDSLRRALLASADRGVFELSTQCLPSRDEEAQDQVWDYWLERYKSTCWTTPVLLREVGLTPFHTPSEEHGPFHVDVRHPANPGEVEVDMVVGDFQRAFSDRIRNERSPMSGPRRIFVDFNNRVKRDDTGEYYRVALGEIDGLEVGSRVLASDFEDIELPVEITALLHREEAAIVRVVRMREFPAVIVSMQGPASVDPVVVQTGSLDSLGVRLPA